MSKMVSSLVVIILWDSSKETLNELSTSWEEIEIKLFRSHEKLNKKLGDEKSWAGN